MSTWMLQSLNVMDASDFVEALAGVFEHSPWVAAAVTGDRPFADRAALHRAMCDAVDAAGEDAQLALIRAHPELAGRAAIAGELTDASAREQQGAGLDRCSAEEFAAIQSLNTAYRERFGFPFIIAVRDHTRQGIIAALRERLCNDPDEEKREALRQINRIAALRLAELVEPA
jgi:2-oxo-4-hydroxy-4-carboxy-5-ureidoimidazoline decarboxylase